MRKAPLALLFERRGHRLVPLASRRGLRSTTRCPNCAMQNTRAWSAERRNQPYVRATHEVRDARRLSALHLRFLVGSGRAFRGIRASLSRLPAGRFAPGRSPEPPACAPATRLPEPHPAPLSRRLMSAALSERDERCIEGECGVNRNKSLGRSFSWRGTTAMFVMAPTRRASAASWSEFGLAYFRSQSRVEI